MWSRVPIQAAAIALAFIAGRAGATPVTSTTPNIDSPAVTPSGSTDFLFTHRFVLIEPKVLNSPTFDLSLGLLSRFSIGVRYATNSDIGTTPNELEALAKGWLLRQADGRPFDLTLEGGYNTSGHSVDGAVVAARTLFDRITVLATVRAFSDIYDAGGAAVSATGGAAIRLTRFLSLVGDVGGILAAEHWSAIQATSSRAAWSGGIAFDIPYTPHSISVYATNANTHTLEGLSRGSLGPFRVGFEFDIPLPTFSQLSAIVVPPEPAKPEAPPGTRAPPSGPPAAPPQQGVTPQQGAAQVVIQRNAFHPGKLTIRAGTSVRWENGDRLKHTVTSVSGDWSSLVLNPGQVYEQRFDRPGVYDYYCQVHPFMKGTVVVE